jgi:hypothetical protein
MYVVEGLRRDDHSQEIMILKKSSGTKRFYSYVLELHTTKTEGEK